MSIAQLAGLAGVSESYLSYAERGLRALDSRSVISALAAALKVSETEIVGGPHLSADPVQAAPHDSIPAYRSAFQTNTLTSAAASDARPLSALVAETQELDDAFMRCDYVALGGRLPSVIDELHVHIAAPADEREQRTALETLIEACMFATFRVKDLGYPDLAHLAATRAEDAARLLDDPVMIGKAAFLRTQTMPRAGTWDRTLSAAGRAADALQRHANDSLSISVLGMLVLSASLAAAVQNKRDAALGWLAEAQELARRVPDDPVRNWSCFSMTNVGVWGVAVAVEAGESGRGVLEKITGIDQAKLATRQSRHVALLADVGRALARDRSSRRAAVSWLLRAESIAPQRIRNSRPVQETVAVLLAQERSDAIGRELRGLAARTGVPH
jgi:transcriptional regulator with XRE-family HTH domain